MINKTISTAHNILFSSNVFQEIRKISDEEMLEHLQCAYEEGWNIHEKYGAEHSNCNALHLCAMRGFLKSAQWLLEKGANPNVRSGNENTFFTFLIISFEECKISVEQLMSFTEILKSYQIDFSLMGYEKKTPLELYARYSPELDERLMNYLIENADFENSFLLIDILKEDKLCTMKNLKTILKYHNLDLKMIKKEEGYIQTYLESIAFELCGKYYNSCYEKISWLHDKLGFDLESCNIYQTPNVLDNDISIHKINALGLAIVAKNNNLFKWILKRKPESIHDDFFIDEKSYTLLEYSLICGFRKGVKLAFNKMNHEELMLLNIPALQELAQKGHNTDSWMLETFDKTYTAKLYKQMSEKYQTPQKKKSAIKI